MRIDHLAIWVEDIEKMRQFYQTYFEATCGEKYVNQKKNYESYSYSNSYLNHFYVNGLCCRNCTIKIIHVIRGNCQRAGILRFSQQG